MAELDLTYDRHKGARMLKAGAKVSQGWQAWKNGYGFFGRGFIDHPGDLRICVDMRILARFPAQLSQQASSFPDTLTFQGDFDFGFFGIRSGKTAAVLYLEHCLAATEGRKKRYLSSSRISIGESSGIDYEAEVALTVISAREKPPAVSWQRSESRVYSTGFERNRSRH